MTTKHFHEGERQLQRKTGMHERIDKLSHHMMRDFMPDQHRQFFEELSYIFLGTIDGDGLPHASIVTGEDGFISSPDAKTLTILTGHQSKKSAFNNLAIGQPIGVLGIDLSNRRRNRMHGRISSLDDDSITITVEQSYGNCPKYISIREIADHVEPQGEFDISTHETLEAMDIDIIRSADTFFIASYLQDGSGAPYEGADMSHRGGQPGFVTIDNPSCITIPDYKGNFLFNTFGNFLLNPNAALLFLDFETGDQLHIHGQTELIEDDELVGRFPGAQRLLRVQIKQVTHQAAITPLRWHLVESSPFNPKLTGDQT